jgi:hypothetical protein
MPAAFERELKATLLELAKLQTAKKVTFGFWP